MRSRKPLSWFECEWRPLTVFGAPMLGCTLFSRLVFEMAARQDATTLDARLHGYLAGHPFLIVGDPRPKKFVPRPALAAHEFLHQTVGSPEAMKAQRWVPDSYVGKPIEQWLNEAISDVKPAQHSVNQISSVIHKDERVLFCDRTSATFSCPAYHYRDVSWVVDVLIDPEMVSIDEICELLSIIGTVGFGTNASRGFGKFSLGRYRRKDWPSATGNAVYCLGSCSPPPLCRPNGYRFARYRSRIIRGWTGPSSDHRRMEHAKVPILLADVGAIFQLDEVISLNYFGQGIGGSGLLSRNRPEAIAQGYAPAIPVSFLDPNQRLTTSSPSVPAP